VEHLHVVDRYAPTYTPPVEPSRRFLRTRAGARALILAGALFVSYAFFYQAGGWNQNSRFDLVRAIVEQGTLQIDDYRDNTGDLAIVDGHYYSDKAPGLAFLAVPPVAAARPVLSALDVDPASFGALTTLSYLATLAAVALPTALAGLGIYWLALRFGASSGGAAFAGVAFGLATPIWAYATLFWGHALTAALLLGAYAVADALRDSGGARRDIVLGGLVGLAVGWATVSEFTAALPAGLITALAIIHVWGRDPRRRALILVALGGGAFACGLVLATHNVLAFGSPFEFGYSSNVNFPENREGLFGIGGPDLGVFKELLFGSYRGLLPLAPVVVVAPVGLYLLARTREIRASAIVAGCIPLYYLFVNSGYNTWSGGASYGPRHLGAALPFLCLPLAIVWTRATWFARAVLLVLALWGASLSLMAVSTTAITPETFRAPVSDFYWPAFREGRLSLNTVAFYVDGEQFPPEIVDDTFDRQAWNIGEKLSLSGHVSLIPLFVLWAAAATAWWQLGRDPARRRPRRSATHEPDRPANPPHAAPRESPAEVS
jgi:hypothetical protein